MPTIKPAQTYAPEAAGSGGSAKNMLLCQLNFPEYSFSEGEPLLIGIDCEILQREPERARSCFCKHTGRNEGGFDFWLKIASNEQIMEFIKDMLQAVQADWTGFRVTVTVDHRGWRVFALELFAKHPGSETQVSTSNPHQQFFLSDSREERLRRLLGEPPHGSIQ